MTTQYDKLSSHCQFNRLGKVIEILTNPEDNLNLLDYEGELFHLASRHKDGKVLEKLLKYYEKTKLSGNPESYEYKLAKRELLEVVNDIKELSNASEKAIELLKPYIIEDDDSDSRASELEDISDFTYDTDSIIVKIILDSKGGKPFLLSYALLSILNISSGFIPDKMTDLQTDDVAIEEMLSKLLGSSSEHEDV